MPLAARFCRGAVYVIPIPHRPSASRPARRPFPESAGLDCFAHRTPRRFGLIFPVSCRIQMDVPVRIGRSSPWRAANQPLTIAGSAWQTRNNARAHPSGKRRPGTHACVSPPGTSHPQSRFLLRRETARPGAGIRHTCGQSTPRCRVCHCEHSHCRQSPRGRLQAAFAHHVRANHAKTLHVPQDAVTMSIFQCSGRPPIKIRHAPELASPVHWSRHEPMARDHVPPRRRVSFLAPRIRRAAIRRPCRAPQLGRNAIERQQLAPLMVASDLKVRLREGIRQILPAMKVEIHRQKCHIGNGICVPEPLTG